jgi:acyl carrier protein
MPATIFAAQPTASASSVTALTREAVLERIRSHLSEELGIGAAEIQEKSRFKDDLEADSLDLVELVMELEDGYGIRIAEDEAERIKTVGQAVDFVLAHASAHPAS